MGNSLNYLGFRGKVRIIDDVCPGVAVSLDCDQRPGHPAYDFRRHPGLSGSFHAAWLSSRYLILGAAILDPRRARSSGQRGDSST